MIIAKLYGLLGIATEIKGIIATSYRVFAIDQSIPKETFIMKLKAKVTKMMTKPAFFR